MKSTLRIMSVILLLGFVSPLLFTIHAEQDEEDTTLVYPKLSRKFEGGTKIQYDKGEHWIINLLIGTFSGAALGSLTGLSQYDSADTDATNKKIGLFAGVGGLTGGLLGGVFTWIEISRKEQFTVGKDFMDYSWYGGLGGAMLGALSGLIPYASSNNTDDIIQYTGYGAGAGIVVSWVLYFWRPFEETKLDFQAIPLPEETIYRMRAISIF